MLKMVVLIGSMVMDLSKKPHYMFDTPAVDYFFRWRWWVAPVLFLPLVFLMVAYTYNASMNPYLMMIAVSTGILLWTLFEYCIHRFLFHWIGRTASLEHLHYIVHGMHHEYPSDPERVIFPPFASAFVGGGIAVVFYLILPMLVAVALFAGFILGYIWYEFIHYATHQIKWKAGWFVKRKRHHLLHHHSMGFRDKNFGVTTSLWDHVFNTYSV